MNPVPLFLIIVSLPLHLGGCGKEPVAEVKPVEEKVLEVKEEVKPKESVAETKPKTEGVNEEELERREGIMYLKGSDAPYTGKVYGLYPNGHKEYETDFWNGKKDGIDTAWYENGNKKEEAIWKNGKQDDLQTRWYENGQKKGEATFKDDELISGKLWNSKGEPVDSLEEAEE